MLLRPQPIIEPSDRVKTQQLRSRGWRGGLFLERDPCPDCILDDVGSAFAVSAVGGSAFYFIKGLRNSPRGARIAGGAEAMCMNVPHVGGGFAVWGGHCAFVYEGKKEYPYNAILSGAVTCGILSLRHGFSSAVRASLVGAARFALLSGAGVMFERLAVPNTESMPVDDPFVPHVETSSGGGWFGGLFGKKVEEGTANSSSKTETYDAPSSLIPLFEYK